MNPTLHAVINVPSFSTNCTQALNLPVDGGLQKNQEVQGEGVRLAGQRPEVRLRSVGVCGSVLLSLMYSNLGAPRCG